MWNEEEPAVISKGLEQIIAGQTFSAKPIGPISISAGIERFHHMRMIT